MTLTTPSLLFPAISLLLLAYTNRFVTLTSVIRELGRVEANRHDELIRRQIESLRVRVQLIRAMQFFAVLSFAVCTLSMLCLFLTWLRTGSTLFGIALGLLTISLFVSLFEVHLSTNAINLELKRLDRDLARKQSLGRVY